ncbi:unnamed protein product [Schistosoma margrebowiei]|uniref:Uncharacterized protein n=1 Tax=Schistosoma margrebowiei TaxID=48269 RepID=A0A3P7WPU5_9TREM|nr:unnamed protein product [Schistosoma margrebowiei]
MKDLFVWMAGGEVIHIGLSLEAIRVPGEIIDSKVFDFEFEMKETCSGIVSDFSSTLTLL